MTCRLFPAAVTAAVCFASAASAAPDAPTFDADLLPLFRQHCLGCHNPDRQKGGLDLSTFAGLKAGGSSGDVVAPGNPDKSRLFTLAAHTEEPKMPPNAGRMADAQVELLRRWIEQGGRENAGSKAAVAAAAPARSAKPIAVRRPTGPPPMPAAGKLALDPAFRGRRPGPVTALAASPWAPLVAVGAHRQVLLYHADTAALVGVLAFPHGQVNALAFSRDGGKLLAAGGRPAAAGRAVLFDITSGQVVAEVGAAETDAVLAADLSPDQELIAVGTATRAVRVYRAADGSVAYTLAKKHTDWVTAVAFSPDNKLLATADRAGGLLVWEAATGREEFALRGHTAGVADLAWRPDAQVVASAADDGTVRLWDADAGTQTKMLQAHGGGALAVRFAADGKLVTAGRDRTSKLWDAAGRPQKAARSLSDVGLRVAVTADAGNVVVGVADGSVDVWNPADGKPVAALDANPPPLADRLKAVEAAVAAAEATARQAANHLAEVRRRAGQLAAELTAAEQAVGDTAKAAEAAKAAAADRRAEFERAVAVGRDARQRQLDRSQVATGVAGRAFEWAAVVGTVAGPAARAEQLAAAKAATDAASAQRAAADRLSVAQKALAEAAAAAANAPKRVPDLRKAAKMAADAVAPAEKAASQSAGAFGAARARLEQTRGVTTAGR